MTGSSSCSVALRCGGCPLIALTPEQQKEAKLATVQRALAGAPGKPVEPLWVPTGPSLGYRNRVRVAVSPAGKVSFFNRNKSDGCAVLEPALLDAVGHICGLSEVMPELFSGLAHLEVRGKDADGLWGLHGVPRAADSYLNHSDLQEALGEGFLLGIQGLCAAEQRYRLGGDLYTYVPLGAFLQVHHETNQALVRHLVDGALARPIRTFADLYSGAGNFALPLAHAGLRGVAVERDGDAILGLRRALAEQRLLLEEAVDDDVPARLRSWVQAGRRFDLLVVDPPRAGLGGLAELVTKLATHCVAMVSCFTAALARDIEALCTRGFTVESVFVFDMFPQTAQVETLTWLRAPEPGP